MGAIKTFIWILVFVAIGRMLPGEVSAETSVVTSIQVSVRTDSSGTFTETRTVVTTHTSTAVASSTSTYVMPPIPPRKNDQIKMPESKDGMCEGKQGIMCAAAAAPLAMALLPMLKGLGDKAKGDSKCPPGGGGDAKKGPSGASPDPQSMCARENDTKKARAKGQK